MINIVIADDHKRVRERVKKLFEDNDRYTIVGEASDGFECMSVVNKLNPDIVLMDINMPGLNGIQTVKIMREYGLNHRVIMLATGSDDKGIAKALKCNCNGLVIKNSDVEAYATAFDTVMSGKKYIQPDVSDIVGLQYDMSKNVCSKLNELTHREYEVLKMITNGLLNKEIACKLSISERTVKNHISNIFKKINVSDRTQAAIYAIKNNIISNE